MDQDLMERILQDNKFVKDVKAKEFPFIKMEKTNIRQKISALIILTRQL